MKHVHVSRARTCGRTRKTRNGACAKANMLLVPSASAHSAIAAERHFSALFKTRRTPLSSVVMLAFVAFFPWPSCAWSAQGFVRCSGMPQQQRQQAVLSLSISISTRGRAEQQLYPAAGVGGGHTHALLVSLHQSGYNLCRTIN